jgi:NADP-dependent 3-hydroxy acid dehydrogenase YdfG
MTKFFKLAGKTTFITGASSGLGEQFAKTLSNAGSRVILTARRIDKLEELAKTLKNTREIQMDVANQNSVKSAFETLEQTGEKIDICINNAGIAKLTPIFEDDLEKDFENQIQTNVMGVWYVTKAVA